MAPGEDSLSLAVIGRSAKALSRAFDDVLVAAGGSTPTWQVLHALATGDHRTQGDLAAAVGVRQPTLVHHLDALERAGLVTRERADGNRRVQRVTVTESGEAAVPAAAPRGGVLRRPAAGRAWTTTTSSTLRRLLGPARRRTRSRTDAPLTSPLGRAVHAWPAMAIVRRSRTTPSSILEADGDETRTGGAITVALCGSWTHEPPCPLAPHHTRVQRSGARADPAAALRRRPGRRAAGARAGRGGTGPRLGRHPGRQPDGVAAAWSPAPRPCELDGGSDHARRLTRELRLRAPSRGRRRRPGRAAAPARARCG